MQEDGLINYDIKIIINTAFMIDYEEIQAKQVNADAYIPKPIDIQSIHDLFQKFFS